MRYNIIAIAFALSAVGLADKLEFEDVPRNCIDICTPVVTLTTGCDDRGPNDDDFAELQCICNAQNANTQIPNCADCIWRNGGKFDNDAQDLVRDCGFTAVSGAPAGPTPTGPRPGGPSSGTTPTNPPSNNNPGGNNSNGNNNNVGTGTGTQGTGTQDDVQGNAQPVGNSANSPTVALAAAFAGLVGFAGLYL
ncbi:hypothetical protein COCC4DRAFT_34673 [Bipolaris maydis ATCC 48331]|uniref:Extracellular membrane protein CFEM domain-containing protein n=2 Tax=Cochliobolus heterostrophus TaxID=5016 RepID=M2UD37_COCH5|nr:uncharacterized protein COCC4DRAFT_34673 [Bipolaris maydis ATCC 48331]EMD85807.1 hypothetical protein COCHEDRAFT_1024380 [Bipolaris maydis C5]KAJ5026219.1 hypothetical protein J3E73DRAFT_314245 [Bipolaris maydis]ENH99806.1 hypothetical protein COCC4DRAFT_34673 [Bipolaris maydis ATCC 48331]KAJ5056759.1 hypothetical protein J3E74DRAFT_375191 [Bipolaris maydis]KAJ6196346.1 hypothetical protein J3E72DRAFT_334661 [Bipolaris maydis]